MTSMATAGTRWGIVMSRNAGFSDQVMFLHIFWTVIQMEIISLFGINGLCFLGGRA